MKKKEEIKVPGVITYVDDELYLGRVKANAPGLFQSDNPENELPWIYPKQQTHADHFSSPRKGDKIWVIHPPENYLEYWYEPMFQLTEDARQILSDYENAEILLSRKVGSGQLTQVYFTDQQGLNLKSDGSAVNLTASGEIDIKCAQNKEVLVHADLVKVGDTNGVYEPAVLGDKLSTLFSNLINNLDAIATAAQGSPYTTHLYAPIKQAAAQLQSDASQILSQNVKLN